MTAQETKVKLRKYLGLHGIHALSLSGDEDRIRVYHSRQLSKKVKGELEREASPYPLEYHQEDMVVMG